MSDENSTSKKSILYTVIITLLLGGSAPWWFDKVFSKKPEATLSAPSTETGSPSANTPSTQDHPSTREEIERLFTLDEFGTWGQSIVGDNEVDTDDGDVVPVKFISELIHTESTIRLRVSLNIREDGGDHTTFDHTIEKLLYDARPGKKIVDVRVKGNQYTVQLDDQSRGQNHQVTAFKNFVGTYWNSLHFRVDGPGSNDNTVIGVKGSMKYTVVLEDR